MLFTHTIITVVNDVLHTGHPTSHAASMHVCAAAEASMATRHQCVMPRQTLHIPTGAAAGADVQAAQQTPTSMNWVQGRGPFQTRCDTVPASCMTSKHRLHDWEGGVPERHKHRE